MSENGEIYTAGKNFTLPPALTGWTNSTSAEDKCNSCTKEKTSEQTRGGRHGHLGQTLWGERGGGDKYEPELGEEGNSRMK